MGERGGLSISHPSRFVLVGSANPEEGEPRPQLLDRFGLYVTQQNMRLSPDERIMIVIRRSNYESDPDSFRAMWSAQQTELSDIVRDSSNVLEMVTMPLEIALLVAQTCTTIGIEGMR